MITLKKLFLRGALAVLAFSPLLIADLSNAEPPADSYEDNAYLSEDIATAKSGVQKGLFDKPLNFLDPFTLKEKTLPFSQMGINAFVNDSRFGSIRSQFNEVSRTLKLKYVRILFAWNSQVQPTPNSPINYSFYDDIERNIPRGVTAVVVLTGVPTWMSQPNNWVNGDPRNTFVQKWVVPTVQRYRRSSRITAWQIWNEPNMESNPDNRTLDILTSPANYVDMLADAYSSIKSIAPADKVVNAATTAINQNYPRTLDYNREMIKLGLLSATDVFAFHYYGKQIENIVRPNGVESVLKSITKSMWMTESGEKGVLNQRTYARKVWPYLKDKFKQLDRLYVYQFTDSSPADKSYGLRTLSKTQPVSDLYIHLRDRK